MVFHEKGEKHPYLTEDEHLEVGDKVLVQAGPYRAGASRQDRVN